MNKQSGMLYACASILALIFLMSGCSPFPEYRPIPTNTPPPTPTSTDIPTATPRPTVAPTLAPSATAKPPTATLTPPRVLTTTPTRAPSATSVPGKAASTSAPLATAAPTQPASNVGSKPPAASSKEICLGCHGPFDKLVTASANYLWPNGDKTTPHRYVPHNSKDIPECSNCHEAHPLPPTASDIADMAKPDPQWCYTCHHQGVLKCGTCHEP